MWCNSDAGLSVCVCVCVCETMNEYFGSQCRSDSMFKTIFPSSKMIGSIGKPLPSQLRHLSVCVYVYVCVCVLITACMPVCMHIDVFCTCACVCEWQGGYLCHHTCMCALIENAPRCRCLCLPRTYICMKPVCSCVCVCMGGFTNY